MHVNGDEPSQVALVEAENTRLRAEIIQLSEMYVAVLKEAQSQDKQTGNPAEQQNSFDTADNVRTAMSKGMFSVMAMSLELTRVPLVMRLNFFKRRHARRLALALKRHNLIDTKWYVQKYPEVAASGQDPTMYFVTIGIKAGHAPHPLFD